MNRKVIPHGNAPGAPVGAALVQAAGLAWVNGVLPVDVDNPSKALAESVEEQSRHIMRNLDQLLQDLGLARQRELDELRGRIDRLERQLRSGSGGGPESYGELPD